MINKRRMVLLFVLAALLIYTFLSISPVYTNPFLRSATPQNLAIIAHRGASGMAPENTLAAFRMAMDRKATRIELDVQLTRDSMLVVIHDAFIKDDKGQKIYVRQSTYEQLLSVNPGIPLFQDVLDTVAGQTELLIEVKKYEDYSPETESIILHLIREAGALDWCILQSFHDDILLRLHAQEPAARLNKLFICNLPYTHYIFDGSWPLKDLTTYSYIEEFNVFHVFVTRQLCNSVHREGKKINVWTVNEPSSIKKFAGLAVDGVITDFP